MAAALSPQRGGYRGGWAGWGRPIGLRAPGGTPLVTQLPAEPRGKLLPGVCAGDFALLGSVSVWGGDPGQDGPSCRPPAPPPGSGCDFLAFRGGGSHTGPSGLTGNETEQTPALPSRPSGAAGAAVRAESPPERGSAVRASRGGGVPASEQPGLLKGLPCPPTPSFQ